MFKYFHLGTLYLAYSFHWASTQMNPMTAFLQWLWRVYIQFTKTKGDCICNEFVCLFLLELTYLSASRQWWRQILSSLTQCEYFTLKWVLNIKKKLLKKLSKYGYLTFVNCIFQRYVSWYSESWGEEKKSSFFPMHKFLNLRLLYSQYQYLKGSYVVKYIKYHSKLVTVIFLTEISYSAVHIINSTLKQNFKS